MQRSTYNIYPYYNRWSTALLKRNLVYFLGVHCHDWVMYELGQIVSGDSLNSSCFLSCAAEDGITPPTA
jgi:hypothetical protein